MSKPKNTLKPKPSEVTQSRFWNRLTLDFITTEAGSGLILFVSALLAFVLANSLWGHSYQNLINAPFLITFGPWSHELSLGKWVKEGLMAIFFFIVGLEIKYEILKGHLSDPKTLALPVFGALGGMITPGLIYVLINWGGDLRGWSVPMATDIAFALAVLAIIGKGLPSSLRVFLMTLAIVDDLGAVLIIGIFYNEAMNMNLLPWLLGIMALMLMVRPLFKGRVMDLSMAYLILFMAAWFVSVEAHISTSLTAVACALCVSLKPSISGEKDALTELMHTLHPYVAYLILPVFAFSAAGVNLGQLEPEAFSDLRLWGVAFGLVIGKLLGVLGFAYIAIRLGVAKMPSGVTWSKMAIVASLCGIGFTMSMYISALAFPYKDIALQSTVKLGIFVGSIVSIIMAYAFMYIEKLKKLS
jgi:NhaA family Na+:H+ antiporter